MFTFIMHSLCCLLPAPPIPSSFRCISLYITVCHSYSPDYSTPVSPLSFHRSPEPRPLCALFHHFSMHIISLKTPKDNSYDINSTMTDIWQRQGGKTGRGEERVRADMRK